MNMVQDTHPDYEWYQLFTTPAEVGYAATSRKRTYVIGAHRSRCVCIQDPFELHRRITGACQEHAQTQLQDYLVATEHEILLEALETGALRHVQHRPGERDLSYYLTPRELLSKNQLDSKYRQQFQVAPENNRNLVYNLGDNAAYTTGWSATSGAMPALRLGGGSAKFWLPASGRWMTYKEKLCAMSFPVSMETAEAMRVPILGVTDVKRAGQLLGNCMHFTTAGIFQLIALACFAPADFEAWGFC